MNHIILIGFMGAGKTSIGQEIAALENLKFVDTDRWIEDRQGRSISDIFAEKGEACFRDMETEALRQLMKETQRMVIAVGGGLPVRAENRAYLRELGTVIYLTASAGTLEERLSCDTTRPKLRGGSLREKIAELMKAREEIYRAAAQRTVSTDNKSVRQIAKEICENVL